MKQPWIFALLVAVATSPRAESQPSQGPALWVARGGSAVVYVFGRMATRSDTQWLTPAIEAAFDASDELWVENPRADGDRGTELIGRHGFAEGHSVLGALGQHDRDRVIRVLERAGMDADVLDGRKAWLANLFLTQLLDGANGVDAASLPDTVFRRRAEARGISVLSEWRAIEDLVAYSVRLPETVQVQLLSRALDDAESYGARLDAWMRGDVDALATLADATARAHPDAHRVVNAERNARWVERIHTMLGDEDTEFVAVGIGHLVGPDNLLSQLQATGVDVERLN